METLVFDIETDDIQATTIHCLVTKELSTGNVKKYGPSTLEHGLRDLEDADILIGHNIINFDVPVLKRLTDVDLSGVKLVDTLVLSRLNNPERLGGHSLANWGELLGFPKQEQPDFHHYTDEMLEYCANDVELNYLVWLKLRDTLLNTPIAAGIEHEVAGIVHKMCVRGVPFDEQGAVELLQELLTEKEQLEAKVDELLPVMYRIKGKVKSLSRAPNKNHWGHGMVEAGVEYSEVEPYKLSPTSRQDIAKYFIHTHGWKPTKFTPTGQPMINDEVLRGMPWSEAGVLADLFQTVKLIGYIQSEPDPKGRGGGWLHHCKDGRIHADFIPLATVTGRPACRNPNLQQVSSDPRARRLFGFREDGPVTWRSQVKDRDWLMVGVDADGQELRMLAHYLWAYDDGAYAKMVNEGDVHTHVQNMIGFNSRNITKNAEYGLIYGASDERLGLISLKDRLEAGKKPIKNLRKEGKRIRQAILEGVTGFDRLLKAVQAKAKGLGRLKGLDGRTLYVRSPHSALNLLLQSAGAVHMKATMVMAQRRLKEAGFLEDIDYGLILWVHDELQYLVEPSIAGVVGNLVADCVADSAIELGIRTPMYGSYKVGTTWADTH